jgi:deoxycytidylate deaminase
MILVPQALVPEQFIPPEGLLDLTELRHSERGLYCGSQFKWVDVKLESDPTRENLLQSFLALPNLGIRTADLFYQIGDLGKRSTCERAHISAVVCDPYLNTLSRGYNRKPNFLNLPCGQLGCEPQTTCRLTQHAESVAFDGIVPHHAAKGGRTILFCLAVPCLDCMKLCTSNRVQIIVYKDARPQPEYDRPVMSAYTIKSPMLFLQMRDV